jgi:hypothetical protein
MEEATDKCEIRRRWSSGKNIFFATVNKKNLQQLEISQMC